MTAMMTSFVTIASHVAVLGFLLLSPSNALLGSKNKKLARVKAGTQHNDHDPIHVIVNKVGPFNNPTETYRFYSLPYCQQHTTEVVVSEEEDEETSTSQATTKVMGDRAGGQMIRQRLGETVAGDHKESSPFEITFMDNVDFRHLCTKTLSPGDIEAFKKSILNTYFFEMFIEDLPMHGYVGEVGNGDEDLLTTMMEIEKVCLFTHLHFILGVNEGRIVSAEISTVRYLEKLDITDSSNDIEVRFTYSVQWYPSYLDWKDRFQINRHFLPRSFEIHWLSIINSCVLVLLLTVFLTIIMMKVLKNDLSRYMNVDGDTIEEEESGWKLIHGDVFRFPSKPALFCAFYGAGIQLLCLAFSLLFLALGQIVSVTRRGSIPAGIIVLYCLTSFVGGFCSSCLYRKMNGLSWMRNTFYTATIFPVPVIIMFSYVNTVAWAHSSTQAIPFGTICIIGALYLLLSFPLTILGSVVARHYVKPNFNAPTCTAKIERQIPDNVSWFKYKGAQIFLAGFLPFTAIYIELNYILESIWGHSIYTLFGILLFTLVLLLVVTSFITIALLYFQLAREDHKWWWISFIDGGSTGIFILAYSWFWYFKRSEMEGVLQGSFFFTYMAVISYAFFLLLGSCSFLSSLAFVRGIYGRLKID